ncbi:MAG TPA: hypothetical protein VEX69_02515 [Candidatus Limnocylindria bacterium]|nr:hypothetical protein [Candidatus Limnocylindria bacterium]
MHRTACAIAMTAALFAPSVSTARTSNSAPQKKEYLTQSEADKIRDAETPGERIKIFVAIAEDRLKKFQYELGRTVPERRRSEILNNLLNGYAGCFDDAADQIEIARGKQADIRVALKLMKSKGQQFLDVLEKLDQGGPEFEMYKDTLEDAIEGTKDALADVEKAEKEMAPPPVRRKAT